MIALRAMLPDDRLVDVAQIPCGLFGAIATAGIARRCGASRAASLAAGAGWILAPAVFLQMPTDYVDVACAAFFLSAIYFVLAVSVEPAGSPPTEPAGSPPTEPAGSPPTEPAGSPSIAAASRARVRKALVLGGLALGLYVGTKPNAPVSAAVVAVLLLWVGIRAREGGAVVVALLLVAAGGETFVVNTIRYGNPVWPVDVRLGPLVLHGNTSMQHLLDSGAAAPHLHGSMLSRIARSWTAVTSPPVFDMRIGGFGPLVLAAAPAALVTLVRRKDPIAWGALVATVVAPDPSVARYVMSFPALLLAFAAPCAGALPGASRPWIGAVAGLVGLAQIAYAWPGLTGEGPPLWAYAHMTEAQRDEAVGANGSPTPFVAVRRKVGAGETFAFDQSLDLPYLAWESDLRYRAVWIPDSVSSSRSFDQFLESENVRVVATAEDSPMGDWLRQKPERFLKLFDCKSAPCSVFARR
jgi:hypothetical protein